MATHQSRPAEQNGRALPAATQESIASGTSHTSATSAASAVSAVSAASAASKPVRPSLRVWWDRAWPIIRGPYPTLISRAVLGGVFLFSGVAKALDPGGFATDIKAYQMLPAGPVISIMAYGLPLLEILLGIYLLAGLYLRWSAVVTGALLVIFMIAMGQAVARGLQLQCGCFGAAVGASLRDDVSVWSILRDGVWLLMAAHLFFVPSIWAADSRIQRARRVRATQPGRVGTAPAPSASAATSRPTSASTAARRSPGRPNSARRGR